MSIGDNTYGVPLPGMGSDPGPNPSAVPQPGDVSATANPPANANAPQQPAPAQPDQKQPFWKSLLQGALRGLAGSAGSKTFGGGLGAGAQGEIEGEQRDINNKLAADANARSNAQSASGIRFQDMQSAKAAADINRTGIQIAGMNNDLQQSKEKFGMDQVDFNQRNFGTQYKSVPFTQENARLYLQQGSNGTAGAHVPDGVVVTPKTMYIPVSEGENSIASDYTRYKAQGDAIGLNTISRAQYMSMNPAQRRATAQITNDVFSGNAQPQQVNARINLLQSSIAGYASKPNADPGMLQHMKDVLAQYQNLKSMNNSDDTRKNDLRTSGNLEVARERNGGRYSGYINPSSGTIDTMRADTAAAAHASPATGASVKAQTGIGLLNEIDTGAINMRAAIKGLKTPFTPEQQIQLAAASSHNSLAKFAALSTLSPDQKNYVTALNSLREGAMSYRGISGQGAGSDQQRLALFDAMPNSLQPIDMQLSALDRFDQQRNAIRASIPKVNNSTLPNQPAGDQARQYTNLHSNGKTTIGLSNGKWYDTSTNQEYK